MIQVGDTIQHNGMGGERGEVLEVYTAVTTGAFSGLKISWNRGYIQTSYLMRNEDEAAELADMVKVHGPR